jgi:hypothetical protein
MSLLRSLLALRARSVWVALAVVAFKIALGLYLARQPSDWLPLTASCLDTLALFLLQGIPMRLTMLVGTICWIANNVIAGSVGGTALEVVVAMVNPGDHCADGASAGGNTVPILPHINR